MIKNKNPIQQKLSDIIGQFEIKWIWVWCSDDEKSYTSVSFFVFNGISTFDNLFNVKVILVGEQLWYYSTDNQVGKWVHIFPKVFLLKWT